MNLAARVLAGCFELWHRFLSPALPGACRYHPTCSQYGAEALRSHGLRRGMLLAFLRLSRCHPWGRSGDDPVPRF